MAVMSTNTIRSACLLLATTVLASACGSELPESDVVAKTVELAAERIVLDGAPWGLVVDGGTVWVSDASRAVLTRLDARDGTIMGEVSTGATDPRDAGMAVADGRLWVANLGGSVGVLDTTTAAVVQRVEVGPGEPAAVASGGDAMWLPLHGPGGGLTRIDRSLPGGGAARVDLAESGFALAASDSKMWIAGLDRLLFAVDLVSAEVTRTVDLGDAPRGVAVAGGDVWVTLRDARQVVRVDGTTGEEIARIPTDGQPWPIAAGGGYVWAAVTEGRLLRIDPGSNEVTAWAPVGPDARTVVVGAGAVWTASQSGVVVRVPLRTR